MALWSVVRDMHPELFSGYSEEFPRDLRCFLGDWLEKHPWEFITGSDSFSAFMADSLLSALMEKLQDLANQNCQPGLILQLTTNLENAYRRDPLQLARTVKQILDAERVAVQNQFQCLPLSFHRQQEELKFGFDLKRLQYKLQEIRALYGNLEDGSRVSLQINTVDPQFSTQGDLQANTLHTLFSEVAKELETAKTRLLKRLDIWKRQQQLAGNGTPFDEDLAPLQKRFESLVDVCFKLRQQVVALAAQLGADLQSCLQERLEIVFNTLVKSAFLVDKQPPQVLKTQTKFQATVRFLLGSQLFKVPQTSFSVSANIVTEKQARELAAGHPDASLCESTGEIVNNVAPLETATTSNACCAVFKNMLLKKIKRSDRKSTESVTEEKCAVLFSARINLGSNSTTFLLQALSLPIVVIVHGNQDNNAKATILWDNAFAAKDRIPFVVTERVPWGNMCETLNQKFMAEVQTTKGLLKEHYFFLAQKIFNDNNASYEDFQSRCVSWSQFNKEILPNRGFTFWQWFEGILELTKKYLKDYWSDRLILGFVSRQYVSSCLSNAPAGTFLLRFSDSLIGGISIAYVIRLPNGSCEVENIQPFTATSLSVRSLADCVLDLQELQVLYPNRPKREAFQNYFNEELPRKNNKEYVPTRIRITVGTPSEPALPEQNLHSSMSLGNPTAFVYSEHSSLSPAKQNVLGSMPNLSVNPGIPTDPVYSDLPLAPESEWLPQGNASPLEPMESAMDIGLPDISLHGIVDFPMPLDPLASENLHPPSIYELEQLIQHQPPLLHYSRNPGPTLTNLCS
ncbi:PREDICTED: signal transducer and activator of transcription 6 [Gekko japonicus]|uniref:Signal transducer and activator of transcription n=1 Tax=Gekko japonicus TaxID=146911 RepID=A0ABM1KYM9_GEKJA|nr:PREDICTED: signal transducer and activator of transcription 6 [Gekko japonicus]